MRSDALYQADMVQAADAIARSVEGMDEHRFVGDDLVRSAVLHKLAVIGEAAADRLFELLAGHNAAVKKYLQATAAGSKPGQDQALAALTGNAAEIARFLSGANPNLPFETVNGLLLAHSGHHVQQIQQIKAGQFGEEARTWGEMRAHMYTVADALAGAIALQFPAKLVAQAR